MWVERTRVERGRWRREKERDTEKEKRSMFSEKGKIDGA